jgi:hypothetical protein
LNLYFLVEGETELHVYRAWVTHAFPALREVSDASEMTEDTYYLRSGGGIPHYLKLLFVCIQDIIANPRIDHLFVCMDAEELTAPQRTAEIDAGLKEAGIDEARRAPSSLVVHVIVHDCCIETWCLGHRDRLLEARRSGKLDAFRRHFDCATRDPEQMPAHPKHRTRAVLHCAYLREMLGRQLPGCSYRKGHPGVVIERAYLDALRRRIETTRHLSSLARLLSRWDALSA